MHSGRLGYIDTLRGLAVFLVVAVHVGQRIPAGTMFSSWSQYGQYGVQLFFVLSSFSLCIAQRDRNADGWETFLIRRISRIAPMYYVTLVMFFLITLYIERVKHEAAFFTPIGEYSCFKVIANLLLLHGLVPSANNTMVPGGWTIGCEFLFYALFPMLYRIMRQHFLYLILAGISGGLLSWVLSGVPWLGPHPGFLFYSLPMQLPCFLTGMSVYHFSKYKAFRLFMLFSAPMALWYLGKAHHVSWGWQISPLLAAIFFGGLLVVAIRWMAWSPKVLRVAGRASFSIYCLHYGFVRLVAEPWSALWLARGGDREMIAWSLFVATLILSTGGALLTYRWIELPFIELGRTWAETVSRRLSQRNKLILPMH